MRFYPSSARLNSRPFEALSEWVFLHSHRGSINYPGCVEARLRQGVQELMLPVWPWMLCLMLPPRGVSLINPPSSVRRCPPSHHPHPNRSLGSESKKEGERFQLCLYNTENLEVWPWSAGVRKESGNMMSYPKVGVKPSCFCNIVLCNNAIIIYYFIPNYYIV